MEWREMIGQTAVGIGRGSGGDGCGERIGYRRGFRFVVLFEFFVFDRHVVTLTNGNKCEMCMVGLVADLPERRSAIHHQHLIMTVPSPSYVERLRPTMHCSDPLDERLGLSAARFASLCSYRGDLGDVSVVDRRSSVASDRWSNGSI